MSSNVSPNIEKRTGTGARAEKKGREGGKYFDRLHEIAGCWAGFAEGIAVSRKAYQRVHVCVSLSPVKCVRVYPCDGMCACWCVCASLTRGKRPFVRTHNQGDAERELRHVKFIPMWRVSKALKATFATFRKRLSL